MARPRRLPPKVFSDSWPDQECSEEVAEIVRRFAVGVRDEVAVRGVRETARATGVDHSTVSRIVSGDIWPDVATLARLELGLDRSLWPRHTGT